MRLWIGCAALCVAGCVSRETSHARDVALEGIDRQDVWSEPPEAASSGAEGGDCLALASKIAAIHPKPRAAESRARAGLARSESVASMPAPIAQFQIWNFPVGDPATADTDGMYMIGVRQPIPVMAGKDGQARANAEMAQADLAMGREMARSIWHAAARACIAWAVAEEIRAEWDAYEANLADLRTAIGAAYAGSGATMLGDVARADAELAGAARRSLDLEQDARVAKETLAALGGPRLRLPEHAPALPTPAPIEDEDATLALALSRRGDAAAATALERSAEARADAADAIADVPTFEVGATYMQMPGARAGLSASVAMSLPWLWGESSSAHEAAVEDRKAATAEREASVRDVAVDVRRALAELQAAQRSHTLLVERVLPAATRAVQAEQGSLGSASFSLTSWLLAEQMLLDTRLDEARARGGIAGAWVDLTAATGGRLDVRKDSRGTR